MPPSQPVNLHNMEFTVCVRPEPPGQFTAQPVGIPEIRVVAGSPQEALDQVRQALSQWPGTLYQVAVPVSQGSALPPAAGHARDDPDFDRYLAEIQRFRQEVESQECSSTSSTPTT